LAKKARVYDGTAWQELASAQTDLTAYSTTAQMNAAIVAPGKVLQVKSVLMTASFSTSSTSLVDITGLTVSITPTSATSKVLVFWSASGSSSDISNSGGNGVQLVRNSTNIAISTAGSGSQLTGVLTQRLTPSAEDNKNVAGSFLDSPATTSATTYKMQGIAIGGTLYINRSTGGSTGTVSTLTVMEISA
jgi:hypothetical protein